MTDIVERLIAYRPTNDWGGGVHHTICTEAAGEIKSLRARAEKAEADHQQSSREWRDAFDDMHQRAMKAEATCGKLAAALQQIIDMNVQYAIDRWGDANQAEPMACVRTARRALSEYRKEASE
jgi:hypothetical protein